MDTANLIEEAERWAKNVSESPGNGTAGEDLYGAKLLCDLAAALKASEERAREAEDLAAANVAANKRIVELEQETDRLITQRDRWEEQVGDMAASVGCEEEFSNWHDHKDCVEERVSVLKTERDAARAELAQPYICPNCTAKLRRLDRMDSTGYAAYELDKARKDAAGQNERAQKAEQEAKALRAELARLTTPRPIADAPTDKPVLGIWTDHGGNKCFEVLRWGGRWKGALGTPLYREAEYLPLPEVKP